MLVEREIPFMVIQAHQPPATVSLTDISSEGAGTEVHRVNCWCRTSRHFYLIKDVVAALMVQKPRAFKFLSISMHIISVLLLEIDFFQFCGQICRIIETRLILTCGVSVITLQS